MGVGMLACLWNYVPYLIIGRMLDNTAIGLYQRAVTVSTLPLKAVSAIDYVAFPAISAHLREGGDIKQAYLRAVIFITGVHWPGLIVLALLAHPLVSILLGHNWLAVAPLVFIMALARMFGFAGSLTNSSLLAAGRARQLFLLHLIIVPVSLGLTALSAPYGINAVAWAMCLTAPFEFAVALYFIRQFVSFSLAELFSALRPERRRDAAHRVGTLADCRDAWVGRASPIFDPGGCPGARRNWLGRRPMAHQTPPAGRVAACWFGRAEAPAGTPRSGNGN